MLSVFYGSSKNQQIVILKVDRILIAKPCMHQVTSALAEDEHELAHEWMSIAVNSYIWFGNCTLALCLPFKKQTAGN